MATRVVNGNTATEDGWPLVDQAGCTWITVPGTGVSLQIQSGIPAQIMGAVAADFNAYIEPLRDPDSACWTDSNSVLGTPGQNNGSNHLGGTAMDLNWNSHPFQTRGTFTAGQMGMVRELLDFYEGMIFWAGDWDDPVDEMHWQMGYNTYNNQAGCRDFIARKIRADGFSTMRRGVPSPPPPTPAPSAQQATILAAAAGITTAKAAEILPTLSAGLALAQCNTVSRIAMFIAQTCWESDHYNTTEEYGDGPTGDAYKGRTWIQITWKTNYAAFGRWAAAQGLVSDPATFVNDPASLGDIKWAGIGAAWYWIVGRPQINSLCDAGDIVGVTQAINGGQNGIAGRTALWDSALAQGDALLTLLATTTEDEDTMAGWTPENVARAMLLLENQTGVMRPSLSPFRHVGEGNVNTCGGFAWTADGIVHGGFTAQFAVEYGDPVSILLLWEVAQATDPARARDAQLAQRVLQRVAKADLDNANTTLQAWLAAENKAKAT